MKAISTTSLSLLSFLFVGIFSGSFQQAAACNTNSLINVSACDFYTSPSGKYTWDMSGIYQDTIKNDAGCDSFMLISLTINTLVAEHSQHGDSLIGNLGADYYQWINCDQANTPIVNDTNRVFYPQTSGNYAVIVDLGACSDTSPCQYYNCNFGTSISPNVCEPYLSPSGRYVWNISGFYTDTIVHSNGCQELFSVTLTVNNQKPMVSESGTSLFATGSGTIFQWISCDSIAVPWPADDTSSSFTPISSGTYAVIVTTNGCADTSDCFQFNMLGLDQLNGTKLRIYPNPASEIFYVESETAVSLRLIAPDGRLIQEYAAAMRTEINVRSLPAGTYFIKATGENGAYTSKIVVMH